MKLKSDTGLFERMVEDAMNEVACGERGWKEMEANTLMLACFGYLTNHLTHQVLRPLWAFVGIVSAGVIWGITSSIFGF